MNKKSLLLKKVVMTFVAMFICIGTYAQSTQTYGYKLLTSYIDGYTTTFKIEVTNNNSDKVDTYVTTDKVYIENGIGQSFEADEVTSDGTAEAGKTTWTVTFAKDIKTMYGTSYKDNYLITFPEGAIKGSTTQNEKFSVSFSVSDDPKLTYSGVQDGLPTPMFKNEKDGKIILSVSKDDQYADSQIPMDIKNALASADDWKTAMLNANKSLYSVTLGTDITDPANPIHYVTFTLKETPTADFDIVFPAGVLSNGADAKNEEFKVSIKVGDYVSYTMKAADEYNSFTVVPEKIGTYYVQFFKGDEPLEVKYTGTARKAGVAAAPAVTEAASVSGATIDRIYPIVTILDEKKSVAKLDFVDADGNPIEITLGSDYLVTFPIGTIYDLDQTYANDANLSVPVVVKAITDVKFYDTNDQVTTADELTYGVQFNTVTFVKDFANTAPQAISVPFDIKAGDVKDKFAMARLNTITVQEDALTFQFTTLGDDEIAYANMPYLVKATQAGQVSADVPNVKFVDPTMYTSTYTADEAALYNADLEGAVGPGSVKEQKENTYTAAEAAAYNLLLPGAVQISEIGTTIYPKTGVAFASEDEVYAYNATLDGAVKEGDKYYTNVYYTAAEADEYNAALPGAVEEGDIKSAEGDWSVECATTKVYYDFYTTSEKAPITPTGMSEFAALTKSGKLTTVASGTELPAWRWYITSEDKTGVQYSKMNIVLDGEVLDATAIEGVTIEGVSNEGAIFNIAGQRVAAPVKGVNIMNGKKFISK